MVYTEVPTFVNGERFSRDDANTYIRDNLEALKNPPTAVYTTSGHASDYSTNSTSFTNVDGTNMVLTITTTGDGAGGNGDVVIWLNATLYSSSAIYIYFRVLEDGVALHANDGLTASIANTGTAPVSFLFLRANATPGEHAYALQWKVSSGTAEMAANAGTTGRDCKAQFGVRELS